MRVGDLVRYNAAGMRDKTLGLVLDLKQGHPATRGYENTDVVLIQWCMTGEYMPRKELPWGADGYDAPITNGSVWWHQVGKWFEVIGE